MLVEYLVARAVGATAPARVEWAPFDIEAPDGTRIEIKASGYSQSWGGTDSRPNYSFGSVFSDQCWDEAQGKYRWVDPADRVHVWVFALNTTRRSSPYEALNLDCWEFRVVPHAWLLGCRQKSAALSFFDRHDIEPVGWDDLAETIRSAGPNTIVCVTPLNPIDRRSCQRPLRGPSVVPKRRALPASIRSGSRQRLSAKGRIRPTVFLTVNW